MPKMMFVACRTPEIARYWRYFAVDRRDMATGYWGCEYLCYWYPNASVRDIVYEGSTSAYRDAIKRYNFSCSLEDELTGIMSEDGFKAAMMLEWPVYQIDENGKIHGKPFPLGNVLKGKS
jgi:hypothetical protein